MNEDTPLPEVASILPTGSARMLDACFPVVQTAVLTQVRTVVSTLELADARLDPIQLSIVLDLLVGSLVPLADGLYRVSLANFAMRGETP